MYGHQQKGRGHFLPPTSIHIHELFTLISTRFVCLLHMSLISAVVISHGLDQHKPPPLWLQYLLKCRLHNTGGATTVLFLGIISSDMASVAYPYLSRITFLMTAHFLNQGSSGPPSVKCINMADISAHPMAKYY